MIGWFTYSIVIHINYQLQQIKYCQVTVVVICSYWYIQLQPMLNITVDRKTSMLWLQRESGLGNIETS